MQINYKLEIEKLIKNMNESFEDIHQYFEKIDFKSHLENCVSRILDKISSLEKIY